MTRRYRLCLALPLLSLAACGVDVGAPRTADDTGAAPASASRAGAETPVAETPREAGQDAAILAVSSGSPLYLVDASGASLYHLADNDDGGRCDAVCEGAWPPVLVEQARASAGPGLNPALVGAMRHAGGGEQVTYAGKPLYRYAGDAGAGRAAGHDVRDRWGHWRLLDPFGEPLDTMPAAERSDDRPASPDGADDERRSRS